MEGTNHFSIHDTLVATKPWQAIPSPTVPQSPRDPYLLFSTVADLHTSSWALGDTQDDRSYFLCIPGVLPVGCAIARETLLDTETHDRMFL